MNGTTDDIREEIPDLSRRIGAEEAVPPEWESIARFGPLLKVQAWKDIEKFERPVG